MEGIVVYQPGRVGSTNVVVTLRHNGFDETLHVHHYDESGNRYLTGSSYKGKVENPKYITIVRDPVARNLSSFCFGIKGLIAPDILSQNPTDEFKADYFMKLFKHDYILTWFIKEFYKHTAINVYGYDFDKEKGYSIIHGGKLLILKAEDMTRVFPQAIKEFLGKEIHLEQKKRKFPPYLSMVKFLPEEYFDIMYDSTYVNHFYSEEEIKGMFLKWKEEHG